jgi:hypothetical protein
VIGQQAGKALTGSKNIFIGQNTASTTAGENNDIAIGYDIALPQPAVIINLMSEI